jgi:DNA-binding transcriptional LysR family regulator
MPELRQLRYFVAVAEELNFTRAAERLHMTQPPLSAAIRRLEQEVGTELLERTTREVRLTDAGHSLLVGARRTLAEFERSMAEARRAAAGELGELRIAFSWSARFETLPAIGQAFMAGHREVKLLTEEMWNARMPQALRSGAVDLAVALCPEMSAELAYEKIRDERVVALVAGSHLLAAEHEVALDALSGEGFVLFPRELAPRLYDVMIGMCRQAGFEPTVRPESFHTGWELGMLADVHVVALVPESVARELPDGVAALRLSPATDRLETALVWRSDDSSAVGAAFREVARTVFADQPRDTASV